MNACDKYIELISAAMDGEISDVDRASLEAHLEFCPECRKVCEAFSAISGNFPREEKVPENFTAGTMAKIKAEAARPTGFRRFLSGYGRYTGLAAALVVVLLGVRVFTNGGSDLAMDMASSKSASAGGSTAFNAVPQAVAVSQPESEGTNIEYAATESDTVNSIDGAAYPEPCPDVNTEEQDCTENSNRAALDSNSKEPQSFKSATAFLADAGAVTDIDALYAERGYSERYYSVSTLYAPVPEALLELFKADGVFCVYSSENERHYKVPMELLKDFDPDDVFTEIVFDSLTAEYGLIIVTTPPDETEDTP